ncbi:DUF4097 family beta strand repeat-containing protein [Bacillus wiedmannii]|uniref:DUF4097 family beta strand repeat-containing protein n=1 Tax=Bacillus wiedmannii TaxID=1890302 RepID=UPI002404ED27|nr:DUF4097 family beta strand repeat-containing protein [Bacillus wiedmannii]MDF9664049.1 DUF4097 family beta strand repeat-containing protein [Bacillus wiedmannii]
MKKPFKRVLAVTVLVGSVLAFTSACTNDASSDKQKHPIKYEEKSYSIEAGKISQISLSDMDRSVDVVKSNDNEIHITYFENDKESYEINVSDEKNLIMKASTNKELKDYVGLNSDKTHRNVKISVPRGMESGMEIKTSKGDINLSEINISGSVDAITSNGKIKASNVAIEKSFKMETKNDDINLSNVNVKGSVDATVSNGNLDIEKVAVEDTLKLDSKNGGINGTIVGSYDVFSISSKASKGKNNLPENKSGGDKKLDVNANNGDINLKFVR